MARLITWPSDLPASLAGLYDDVSARLGMKPTAVPDLAATRFEPDDLVVVVVDSAPADQVMGVVEALAATNGPVLAFVVGDGYLGTEDASVAGPMAAAATIAAVRSMAVRRGALGRANVVCVPASMFGDSGSQRGPLAQSVEQVDVAEAIAFFLGPDAGYLNGQVLFVDGGRHIFSSMTA